MPPVPCLFDIQVNGFAGIDFQNLELTLADLQLAVRRLREAETHRIFLTLITDSIDALCAKFARIEKFREADPLLAETICGYHLEGPFMSPEDGYRGAHPGECMQAPSLPIFKSLQEAAQGNIRLITLAPEWPGSPEFIAAVAGQGVVVSLGHTNATCEQIDSAIRAGATTITHLGNGTPVTLPRHDNVIQRLLARDELTAFLIPDGAHLPSFVVRNFFRAKPAGRVLFTTDAMAAAGAPPGRYRIGRLEVESQGGVARAPDSQNLAGSCLVPTQGVQNVERWLGLPAAEARALFSTSVAAHFGIRLPEIELSEN